MLHCVLVNVYLLLRRRVINKYSIAAILLQTSNMYPFVRNNFAKDCFNPLSPYDALKHNFTSVQTDLIFLQLGVLE